ncbi:hypothetical protein [Streptomyces sp. NPDC018947]|uniref:hypothetical protein n=1 Tax=Streptomyces sp. NPDC018947 TaxID=3365054 RepID=UPI0037BBB00C
MSQGSGEAISALIVLLAVVALLGSAVGYGRRADKAALDVDSTVGLLCVTPHKALKLLSFRSRITVPLDSITEVSVNPKIWQQCTVRRRRAGLALPGIRYGGFIGDDGHSFWLAGPVASGAPLVLRLTGQPFDYLVIDQADPGSTALRLRNALRGNRR